METRYASSSPRWRLREGGSEIVPKADEGSGILCVETGQEKLGTCSIKEEVKGTQENIGVEIKGNIFKVIKHAKMILL